MAASLHLERETYGRKKAHHQPSEEIHILWHGPVIVMMMIHFQTCWTAFRFAFSCLIQQIVLWSQISQAAWLYDNKAVFCIHYTFGVNISLYKYLILIRMKTLVYKTAT